MSKKQTKKRINKEESDDEISETMEETDDIIDEEDNFQENDEFEEDDGYNDIEELEEPEIFNGCALDKIIEDEIDDIDNDNSEIEEVIVEDKAKVLAALEPQVLFAITLKFPETKLFEILRVIEVVP